jgi:tetratricopeptide (TPR) repeat protein
MQGSVRVLVPVLLIISIFLSPCRAQEAVVARIVTLQGEVQISRDGGQSWQAASPSKELFRADIIKTAQHSRASILLADGTLLKMDANTRLGLVDVAPSTKLRFGAVVKAAVAKARQSLSKLLGGRIWCRSGGAFTVETPAAAIFVRGTEFGVEVKGDGETILSMLEGVAEMYNQQGRISVGAGEMGTARPGEAPVKSLLVRPEDAVQWSLFYPKETSLRDYVFISFEPKSLKGLLKETEEILEKKGPDPTLLVRKGKLLHDLAFWDQASSAFREALILNPSSAEALEGLGWVALQTGDTEEALENFGRVTPATEMSLAGLSVALYRKGLPEAALEVLDGGLRSLGPRPLLLTQSALLRLLWGDVNGAMGQLQEANSLKPTVQAYGLLSNISLVLNQKDQALAWAQEAVKLNPFSSGARVDLAWALQSHFDLQGATREATKAVELDPAHIRAKMTLARLLFGAGYVTEAEGLVEEVLMLNPQEPLAHSLKGYLLLSRGRTDEALAGFQEAIKLDPSQAEPHLGMGIASMRKGDTPLALEEILAATLLEPRVALNFTYLGKALYDLKEFDRALQALEWAKLLDPRDPTPYLYTGIILTDLNQAGPAIRDLEKSVELNDNRAVYRSRFLLDQDRAVRNIDLARSYENLGLTSMARNRALLSLKDDPSNSSAHLFMANTLINEKDRTAAGSSELLKFLLLMPANQNSFNTFNDYTSFFERPKIQGRLEMEAGTQDWQRYNGVIWGAYENLAARQALTYDSDAGFKDTNFKRSWDNMGFFKYQADWNQELLLFYQYREGRTGDRSTDQNAFLREDRDLTEDFDSSNVTLGYHMRTAPHSDILLVVQRETFKLKDLDGKLGEIPWFVGPFKLQQISDKVDLHTLYWHLGGSHTFRWGEHRVVYGFDAFRGETELGETTTNAVINLSPRHLLPPLNVRNRIRPFYLTLYAQDTWRVLPELSIEAGLYYERTEDGSATPYFSSREFDIERVHPRAGLIFQPSRDHTFRLGYARYIMNPFLAAWELRPSDMAGFTIGQDAFNSALQEDLSLAWEGHLSRPVFLRAEIFKSKRTEQLEDPLLRGFSSSKRDFYGGRLDANIMILDYFGFTPGYRYLRSKDHELTWTHSFYPERWREDHELQMGFHFLHPTGWKASFIATYVKQFLRGFQQEAPGDFWFLSLAVQKELWNKQLTIGGRVDNLLDQRFNLVTDVLTGGERREPARRFVFFTIYNF